ncbi:MAG: hypothetical protein MUD14_24475 [Hydrococcus sp. Prado102]|nr:hypothetical protein [Hydrococcus sp. Prado102]
MSIKESNKLFKIETKPSPTYNEKTNRLQAWTQLIKTITPLIWMLVICLVCVPLLGNFLISRSALPQRLTSKDESIVIIDRAFPQTNNLDREIVKAIQEARTHSQSKASEELDIWLDELMTRVDTSFLPWYFDYFTQKKMEFSTPFIWGVSTIAHWVDPHRSSANEAINEKLTETFQSEFAKRVLRPKIAQLKLERITRETTQLYIDDLKNHLSTIQSSYKIPQGQWERYLDDIAITITDTEGNISSLSMKVLVGGSTYLLAKITIPAATKIGSKVVASAVGKASAKIAAKTGGAVATQVGAQLIDPIVGVGIIIWDLWDYHHTVQIERPILREAILEYLQEVKASLLDNRENSIMSAIARV